MRVLERALPVLVVAVALLVPAAAAAHPLGNFTISTAAAIVVAPATVRVDYVVDMAEIPTVQARSDLDADGDGTVSGSERSAWADATAVDLLAGLELRVGGDAVALDVASAGATLLPGEGGLEVLRLDATFVGAVDVEAASIAFADGNYEGHVGWHEVTATGADGVRLVDSDVPPTSATDGLRVYPEDLLSSPLDVRTASLSFEPGTGVTGAADVEPDLAKAGSSAATGGAFAGLIDRTGPLMALAMLLAFGFGAIHALGPGHGKTLMAAYLVGSGGRARHAVAVGAAVATMHTASVLALGFAVLAATSVFAPERVYPWLGVGSGVIAVALGATLLVVRLGRWSEGAAATTHDHAHAEPHAHDHGTPGPAVLSRRGLVALAVAGGVLPSPTALLVLLAAVAARRVGYGLALIASFSLGLAAALVVVGLAALRARDVVERRLSHRATRLVPVLSAGAILVLGCALTLNGLAQI